VNDVLWKEAPSLYGLNDRSQNFIVRNDNEGNSAITFGDGVSGARLPTGQENVMATYRAASGRTAKWMPYPSFSCRINRWHPGSH